MSRDVVVEILGLIGTASPFKQGGSLRLTLPKRIARVLLTRSSAETLEDVTFFFIRTNMGILMCTLSDLIGNPSLKDLAMTRA